MLLKDNKDWPFIITKVKVYPFRSIVRSNDKYRLQKDDCELRYFVKDASTLLFKFKYGGFMGIVNLLNRNREWMKEYYVKDQIISIYPESIKKKVMIESGKRD